MKVRDLIVVIDFGGPQSQLIARRVRSCQVYCEIWPYTTPLTELRARNVKGVILAGGPQSVGSEGAPQVDEALFARDIPVMAVGYGAQLMTQALGGRLRPAEGREEGRAQAEILESTPLFEGLPIADNRLEVWLSGGDVVEAPPTGFTVMARSDDAPVAAMGHATKPLYGLLFRPEVSDTPHGIEIIRNFLFRVCGCEPIWTMESFIEEQVAEIRELVGNEGKVLCGLSGGVDSSVAATLVHRALGDRLYTIFVDHGFMRKGEPEKIQEIFSERFGSNFIAVDASERFLAKLDGVSDPEEKRKIIGNEFIRVFEEEAERLGDAKYLVQGTLYPDIIESGVGADSVIKSHHNVGGLPEHMQLELIEPLRWLFKDEVRAMGEALGLPKELVWRQPFPGPGLAIRIMGPITRERLEAERECDAIVLEELERAGLTDQIWQSFAVLTDTRSVGVKGNKRTYGYVAAVRAITSTDAMTADWVRIPHEVLDRIALRMMNEVDAVGRVVYDISPKPPATVEWE